MSRPIARHPYFYYLFCLLLLCSCGTSEPFYQSEPDLTAHKAQQKEPEFSLFLVGDTGAPELKGARQVLRTLEYQLDAAGDNSTVLFLGDNIYPDGMPADTAGAERRRAEESLKPSLKLLEAYPGRAFFIPGNHDWMHGRQGIRVQEEFIEQYGRPNVQFVPDNGCPGPNGFDVGKNWYVIALDSEWWINQSFDQTQTVPESCAQQSRTAVMEKVEALIKQNEDKQIVVAFHHPLHSNGNHGGYYSVRDHLFPLTNLVDYLYVPLPLLGSAYPLTRQLGISGQDLPHDHYQYFKSELLEAVEGHEINFLVSGHEHTLSFYAKDKKDEAEEGKNYFIVSGAGSKKAYARQGYGADFVYSHKGFAKLVAYADGSIGVEFWVPDLQKKKGRLVYARQLVSPEDEDKPAKTRESQSGTTAAPPDSAEVIASPIYKAGSFKRFMLGDHYRDAWATEVEVPVLNFEQEKGGLEVLAKTGGVQTVTIIVRDSTGQRYVIRSVQKDPRESLPEVLQNTFVTKIAQDQTSASHPYGGLIVPPLARAAGVYHNSPELRYIPGQAPLDIDMGTGEGTLVTVEEFISTDWFNQTFGRDATEMVSTSGLWERLRKGAPATVDQRQLVRSRIFDMFLGDWDRHEGQWFWAKVPTDSLPAYQPIPIDRDNAFYKSDGLMLGLARLWAFPKFQYFGKGIASIKGINLNAQYFDRWFINELSGKEWLDIARKMEQSITDSVITQAVRQWPEPIRKLNGEVFIKKLKARRDKLTDFARRYYKLLSRGVNVYGSDKPELFEVDRLAGGKTRVRLYRSAGKGLWYERVFKAEETEEIRLYGFGEEDTFQIDGIADEAIQVRIIGGREEDIVEDRSTVAAPGVKTLVYDTPAGIRIQSAGEVENKTTPDPRVNRYDKRSFRYDFVGPLLSTGYNENDGVYLGGGVHIIKHGFRKEPFAAEHRITAKLATLTSGFAFNYEGTFTERVGVFDLGLQLDVRGPNYSSNFFGLGNETQTLNRDKDFFGYRYDNVDMETELQERIKDLLQLKVGAGYEYLNLRATENRFVTSPAAGLSSSAFRPQHYATVQAGFNINTVDNTIFPKYGYIFDLLSELKVGLNKQSKTFNRLSTEIRGYYTFEEITTTLAGRVGFATNIGNYTFPQANTLGGQTFSGTSGNLRGYLRDRFSGRSILFHNTEFRTKLFNIQSYYLPASMGILGFVDEGRVWVENEHSDQWHVGYGGGVWISPLERAILTAGYARSGEYDLITVSIGFTF